MRGQTLKPNDEIARSNRADQEMDFGVGICNEGIRWRDIVIGGVVAQLDQIIGSVALEDDGHSHMRAGQFSSIKLPMNADGPISWPSIIPITLYYTLSAVGKALDKRHLSLYNNDQ